MNILLHSFVPHRGNKYKPHAISHIGLAIFALLIFTFQGIYNYQATGSVQVLGYATSVSVPGLLSSTNIERVNNGYSSFQINSSLNQAAQAKAQHMINNDYWDHYAPDGTSPWFFIAQSGYEYNRAGENLAFKFDSSAGAIAGWMDSPTHRANLLDSGFTEVGFGIANGTNYQGDENTVIVAMYGEPIIAQIQTAQAETTLTQTEEPSVAAESTDDPKPAQEKPVAAVGNEEEPQLSSQRLLASLAKDGTIVVTGDTTVDSRAISNFDRLSSGEAHWALYMLSGTLMTLGAIYVMRHLQLIYQVVKNGEHYVTGHPTLEAGLVYAVIWVFIFTSYGVIK